MQKIITFSLSLFALLFFTQCAMVENDFCKNSGHLYGTHNYYDCTKRYDEDPIAYDHCTTVFNFKRESTEQNNCVEYTIPAIRKTFANDKEFCQLEAEKHSYAESMHPLSSIRLTLYNLQKNTSEESVVPHYSDVESTISQQHNAYTHHCLSQKGWQKHFKFLSYDFDGLTWKK